MPLRYLTAGESHGKALVGILEGMPAGLEIRSEDIRDDLARRRLGFGRSARQRLESDPVEVLSGVRHGLTLGSPIALMIPNADFSNWSDVMSIEPGPGKDRRRLDVPRPGHADLAGRIKYGFKDMRDVLERASARETAVRVGLGSLARSFLRACGVAVASRVLEIGGARDDKAPGLEVGRINEAADASPVRATGERASKLMVAAVEKARRAGDTLGGIFEVSVSGLPVGLGSYVQWDRRLEAPLAAALMSLNAVKGVEVGLGFESARTPGSQAHDAYVPKGKGVAYRSNRSGGIDGGMTTGEPLVIRAAMKPLATLMKPLDSVDLRTRRPAKAHVERSDVCAVPAAAVIAESLAALVLADAMLAKFGGDSMDEVLPRLKAWRASHS